MKRLMLLLLLVGCTCPTNYRPRRSSESPKPAQSPAREAWALDWRADDALDALREDRWLDFRTLTLRASPAQPALDASRLRSSTLQALRKRLRPLPVDVAWATGDPIAHAQRVEVRNSDKERSYLGRADGIDEFNQRRKHHLVVWVGRLRDVLRRDGGVVKESALGDALAILILHELGHAWGLRHHVVEIPSDRRWVMAQGHEKYLAAWRKRVLWSPVSYVYLSHVVAK